MWVERFLLGLPQGLLTRSRVIHRLSGCVFVRRQSSGGNNLAALIWRPFDGFVEASRRLAFPQDLFSPRSLSVGANASLAASRGPCPQSAIDKIKARGGQIGRLVRDLQGLRQTCQQPAAKPPLRTPRNVDVTPLISCWRVGSPSWLDSVSSKLSSGNCLR